MFKNAVLPKEYRYTKPGRCIPDLKCLSQKLATKGQKGGKFKSLNLRNDFLKHIVTHNGIPCHFMSFPV